MHLTQEQIDQLIKSAEENGGLCPTCLSTIKLYKYRVNGTMAKIMREMATATKQTGQRPVDMETLDLTHTERSQLSKMRQHGLIVQPKDENGVKRPRHWLITTKGWKFLSGEDVPARVIVFQNQVLGHDGGTTNIRRLLGDPGFYESDPLTTTEARTYRSVRKPQKLKAYRAKYTGTTMSNILDKTLPTNGQEYSIGIERLQVGKPVAVHVWVTKGVTPHFYEYQDIASFQHNWTIIKELE